MHMGSVQRLLRNLRTVLRFLRGWLAGFGLCVRGMRFRIKGTHGWEHRSYG